MCHIDAVSKKCASNKIVLFHVSSPIDAKVKRIKSLPRMLLCQQKFFKDREIKESTQYFVCQTATTVSEHVSLPSE